MKNNIEAVRIINVGDESMDPTVEMPIIIGKKSLTVKDIITLLIENQVDSWKALPENFRDLMLNCPQLFELVKVPTLTQEEGSFDVDIVYNGVVLHWDDINWVFIGIK